MCNRFDVTSQAKPAGPGITELQRDFDSLGKKKKKSESTCSPAAVQRAAAWTDGSFLQDDSKDSVRSESEQRSSSHSVSRGDRRFRLFVLAGD